MALYEIKPEQIVAIPRTSFSDAGLRERQDLQRLFRDQVEIISPDTLVIAEEFGEWEDSRRRIDLLGIDKDGYFVVIELKRDDDSKMDLQAVRYAAMVSTLTFDQAVKVFGRYLTSRGREGDPESLILDFLGWEEPDDESFAPDIRLVLASADFSKELTTSVLWLNDHGIDIRCVRYEPYEDAGRILLDVQQVIPLPEAEDYQIQIREKAARERTARRDQSKRDKLYIRYWTELLEKANARTDLHQRVNPAPRNWLAATMSGFYYSYVFARDGYRVELYITRSDGKENEQILRALEQKKSEIEGDYGGELSWEELPGKTACRIAAKLGSQKIRSEDQWPEMQDRMVEHMILLECATKEHIRLFIEGGDSNVT